MVVYLAAPWARIADARAFREKLLDMGVTVNSRWLDFQVDATKDYDYPEDIMRHEAQNDLEDIDHAEFMVVLNLEKSEGKAVEQGYALARGIPIIAIGKRLNVFQYLDADNAKLYHVYEEEADALAFIQRLLDEPQPLPYHTDDQTLCATCGGDGRNPNAKVAMVPCGACNGSGIEPEDDEEDGADSSEDHAEGTVEDNE